MTTSNFSTPEVEDNRPRKNSKNLIIGILIVALVGVGTFLFIDSDKKGATIQKQQTEIATVTDQKSALQQSFDASLARLDSLSTVNTDLQGKLTRSNSEIAKTKREIRSILNKKNVTAAELSKAKMLIASLNDRITGMEQQIAQLTQDKQNLTHDKMVLVQDSTKLSQDLTATTVTKDSLAQKVDVASTLNADNIVITPIDVRHNGKQKVTTVAKRVDKLLISFDVNNRIAPSGTTDVYVVVIGPDGKPISEKSLNSGTFTTRENGDQAFTAKLPVEIQTDQMKKVQFAFTPANSFQTGDYTVKIYQNGFLIGQQKSALKHGGLFS
jgi:hypothetical protein